MSKTVNADTTVGSISAGSSLMLLIDVRFI